MFRYVICCIWCWNEIEQGGFSYNALYFVFFYELEVRSVYILISPTKTVGLYGMLLLLLWFTLASLGLCLYSMNVIFSILSLGS